MEQKGKDAKPTWHDTALTLDLKAKDAKWQSVPQPFKRRALTAAAVGTKVYVIAGLGAEKTDRQVDILDLATGKWATGPKIPGDDRVAFSPAAAVVNNRWCEHQRGTCVPADPTPATGGRRWATRRRPRHVGRLVPHGSDSVVLLGGAGGGGTGRGGSDQAGREGRAGQGREVKRTTCGITSYNHNALDTLRRDP